MRMIFLNLPVKSAEASRAFFAALGFKHDPRFSSETTTSVVIEENIVLMLLEESRFKDFTTKPIVDANTSNEVLTCFSCSSRAEVDDLYNRAIAAGARPWMPAQDHGFMYGTSFQDPDGHVWELTWMDVATATAGVADA